MLATLAARGRETDVLSGAVDVAIGGRPFGTATRPGDVFESADACARARRASRRGGCRCRHRQLGAQHPHDPRPRRRRRAARARRDDQPARQLVAELRCGGAKAHALVADVLDEAQLTRARDSVLECRGRIAVLVNAAGGNVAAATVAEGSFFELATGAFDDVVRLNLDGTLLSVRVFGNAFSGI